MENVKGGLDSAKELLPGGEATSQQLLKRCFPARLQHAGGSGALAAAFVPAVQLHPGPQWITLHRARNAQQRENANGHHSWRP